MPYFSFTFPSTIQNTPYPLKDADFLAWIVATALCLGQENVASVASSMVSSLYSIVDM
jgi:hypothetical protein